MKTIIQPMNINSREEAERSMERLSELACRQKDIEEQAARSMAAIGAARDEGIAEFAEEMQTLITDLQIWAEKNRDELVAKGKTFALTHGAITFRQLRPKIEIENEENVIEFLRNEGILNLIRIKESVDKHALIKELAFAASLPGVSIIPGGEQVEIKPFTGEA